MGRRGGSCGTTGRKVWTACFIVLWLLLILGTLQCHLAITGLVPELTDLSTNLRFGVYDIFKFKYLKSDSQKVKDNSVSALDECDARPSQCPNPILPWQSLRATTTDESGSIQCAFDDSLESIKIIGEDFYFGVESLAKVSKELGVIQTALNSESWNNQLCAGTNRAYCKIHTSASAIIAGADDALAAIDKMIDNDLVNQFNNYSDQLNYLHGLPYLLWISMFFFAIFWSLDAAPLCCGGGCTGCLASLLYVLFWFISLLISLIITAIGLTIKYAGDSIKLPEGIFNPNIPSDKNHLRGLLDNIQANHADFWATAFEPLEAPMDQFLNASMIFTLFCLLIGMYGCCVCMCRPYTGSDEKNDVTPFDLVSPKNRKGNLGGVASR